MSSYERDHDEQRSDETMETGKPKVGQRSSDAPDAALSSGALPSRGSIGPGCAMMPPVQPLSDHDVVGAALSLAFLLHADGRGFPAAGPGVAGDERVIHKMELRRH